VPTAYVAGTAYTPVSGALPDSTDADTEPLNAERSAAAQALYHPPHLDRNLLQQVIEGLRRL
jgi:hypothetical protein